MEETYYDRFFPDLTQFALDEKLYDASNADKYIRKSYRGGWCFLVKEKANKIYNDGITLDVNSLYPSVMHSESGSKYPHGKPTFWKGNYIPEKCKQDNIYYFIRLKTQFKIKENKLPFIQIKTNFLYMSTASLETSDVYDKKKDKYYEYYIDRNGKKTKATVTLTLTCTDYELMKEHYNLYNTEILDGCYFFSSSGIFDYYIDKYKNIKMNSTGARRELAKLFLNNLYGKMASSDDSSFKVAYLKQDGSIGFKTVEEHKKKTGYIPIGSAITSYARNFTIRHAQANYYGKDKRGFIYADTDSIHCDLTIDEIKMCKIDSKAFCCWKPEASWDIAYFTRQKTYIEHVIKENLKDINNPYYNIKCAGMPDRCKNLFLVSMIGTDEERNDEKYNKEEKEFLKTKRTLEDFTLGLKVPSKLRPVRIAGGIVLEPTTYEMR